MGSFLGFARNLESTLATFAILNETGLHEIGKAVKAEIENRLGYPQEGWSPLAPSTIETKERLGQTGRRSETDPGYATGEFMESVSYHVEPHSVHIGTDVDQAVYFDLGRAGQPPRPIFLPSAEKVLEGAGFLSLIGGSIVLRLIRL